MLVIVDHHSCNLSAVTRAFRGHAFELVDLHSADELVERAKQHAGPVWFVHGTHDVSPEQLNHHVEEALADEFTIRRTGYTPYSPFDRWLMGVVGWQERPPYAVELIEMRR